MRLILIRHAQSVANAEGRWQGKMDFDLSEVGVDQSQRLLKRFTDESIDPTHVYSSPLTRAVSYTHLTLPTKA